MHEKHQDVLDDLSQGKLNDEIKSASVERDFIETKFERSIDKEVEAFKHYATALSDYELGTPEYLERYLSENNIT